MMSHRYCTLLLALLSCAALSPGCKDKSETPSPRPAPPQVPEQADLLAGLHKSADIVLDELEALESEADVTCWTSFRQLDWYIAEKSYGEFATLAKVAAVKALVRAAWQAASEQAQGAKISA